MTCKQGFQQQDSHELLRVLLDGLQTEEAKAIAAKLKHNSAQQVPSIAFFIWLSFGVLSSCALLSTSVFPACYCCSGFTLSLCACWHQFLQ